MPRAKKIALPAAVSPDAPEHFFAAQLRGEDPPSLATMRALYLEAQRVFVNSPWERVSEDELVVCDDPVSGQRYHISVMGALGELRGLQAYIGNPGYLFFRKMQDCVEEMTAGDFFATQNSLYVHWEKIGSLTKPDREMLAAVGHPKTRGLPSPEFRSLRYGYHPWYVTEQEARALTVCLRAFLYAGRIAEGIADRGRWAAASVYPTVAVDEAGDPQSLTAIALPLPKADLGPKPVLDEARVQAILASKIQPGAALQIDHFYGAGKIGERNERPGCVRMVLAADAATGLIYSPQVISPQAHTGDALVEVLLGAIESSGVLTQHVEVRKEELRIPLLPLADLLKIRVHVKQRLPALDMAKDAVLHMMGDPGMLDRG